MSTEAAVGRPDTRTRMLARIARATGPTRDAATIAADWQAIARDYRRSSTMNRDALLHQLDDRLRDYDAGVYRSDAAGLRDLIGRILAERGKHHLAVPAGLPAEWLPEIVSFTDAVTFTEDDRSGLAALEGCDGVLTSATLAIAETGTIVLQDAPGQGRRAVTLLPDYHLCIVDAETIVQTVPEAISRLQATANLATTFFSGPSATADIEMTRIKGVHGPRFVDVILLV